MPALLKRALFQVNDTPNERTSALSSVSNDGHYISIRAFVKPRSQAEEQFPFEWAFAGTNKDINVTKVNDGVVKQDFNFGFDVNVYLNIPNTHRGTVQTVWTNWDSGCIAEHGTVYPGGSDQPGVKFFELWQPVDPSKEDLVMVSSNTDTGKSIVFKTDSSSFQGLFIITGKWSQGYLAKSGESTLKGLNFIRTVEKSQKVETLFQYGVDSEKFPSPTSSVTKGDIVDSNGIKWEVIEAYQ